MPMDDASADISELGIWRRPKRWGESLNSATFGDACDGN